MLSRTKAEYIRSLELKKSRNENNVFVVEGSKSAADMLPAFECELLIVKSSWMAAQGDVPAKELLVVEEDDIRKASFLKNPQDVFVISKRPNWGITKIMPEKESVLVLDGIQDPGNLGTTVRLADWFGTSHVMYSRDTADVLSPKTVQVTMGALTHVEIHYTDLETFLQAQSAQAIPLYGTFLDGENLYEKTLSKSGILIMGNKGNGVHPAIEAFVNEKLYIPNYPEERDTSESFNVAIITAVVCAEFRRRQGSPA